MLRSRIALRAALVLAVVSALGLAACGGDDVETGSVDGVAGGKPVAGARTVTVGASNFDFDPDDLEIDAEEEIALELVSEQGPHDFAVDGLGLVNDVADGERRSARLRIDEPGEYAYFCTLPGHRDGGMSGTLVVRSP